jgi:hypothetical protein
MCGRYYRRSDKQRIAEAFHLGKLPEGFVRSCGQRQYRSAVSLEALADRLRVPT